MRVKILALGLACLFLSNCAAYHWKAFNAPSRRQKYVRENPGISQAIRDAILSGDVLLGMTPSQVVASRGEPWDVNRTTGEWGIHEQWVMRSSDYALSTKKDIMYWYIYFENGIVTSWQSK